MYLLQRKFIYHPDKNMMLPEDYNIPLNEIIFNDTIIWQSDFDAARKTLIYFHGNAVHLGDRARRLHVLSHDYNIIAPSYPQFGRSGGELSEDGIYNSAETAIKYAIEQGVLPQDIILYGESLGTGVAVEMGIRYPKIANIILEAPYISVPSRGQEQFWYLPVKWVLKDKFDTINKIADINANILIMHAVNDVIMPIHHGRVVHQQALSNVAESQKIKMIEYPNQPHWLENLDDIRAEIKNFIE